MEFINTQLDSTEMYVNVIHISTTDIEWSMKLHHEKNGYWFFDIPLFEDGKFQNQVFTSIISRSILNDIIKEYFSKQELFFYFQEYQLNAFLRYCGDNWGIKFSGYDLNFLKKYKE